MTASPLVRVEASQPSTDVRKLYEKARAKAVNELESLRGTQGYQYYLNDFVNNVNKLYRRELAAAGLSYSASSWTELASNDIYLNPGGGEVTPATPREDQKVGDVEKALSAMFRNIGADIESLLDNSGLNLDTIIYGRVNGHARDGINWVSFELKYGNVYGIAGAIIYSILRGIVYVGLAGVFMWMLVKAAGSSSSKGYEKLKANIGNLLLVFLLLSVVPQIVDISLYIRDHALVGVSKIQDMPFLAGKNIFTEATDIQAPYTEAEYYQASQDKANIWANFNPGYSGSGTSTYIPTYDYSTARKIVKEYERYLELKDSIQGKKGIAGIYYKQAVMTEELVPAAMYLSLVLLSLYFLFVYTSTAVCFLLAFGFFPVVALLSFMDNNLLKTWVKTIFSFILTPVVDAVVLVVPILVYALGAPTLVSFLVCMVIIPSRSIVKNLIGVGGSIVSEMLGIGSMMMLGRMAGSTFRGARSVKEGLGQAWEDRKQSKMYEGLSQIEKPNVPLTGHLGKGMSAEDTAKLTAYTEQRNEALRGFATYKNFENPVFKDALSDSDRAKFYRQRSASLVGASAGKVAGSIVGGGFGLSATMFSSFPIKAGVASLGGSIGGAIGGGTGRKMGAAIGSIELSEFDGFSMPDLPSLEQVRDGIEAHLPGGAARLAERQAYTEELEAYFNRISNPISPAKGQAAGNLLQGGLISTNSSVGTSPTVEMFSGSISAKNRDEYTKRIDNKWSELLRTRQDNGFGKYMLTAMGVTPKGNDEVAYSRAMDEAFARYDNIKSKNQTMEIDANLRKIAMINEVENSFPDQTPEVKLKLIAELDKTYSADFKGYKEALIKDKM